MKTIKTKYGDCILVKLQNFEKDVILPKRFSKLIENINDLNIRFQNENIFLITEPPKGKFIPASFSN